MLTSGTDNIGSDFNDKISSIQNLRPNNYKCTWYQ
jgi:hypothetical protein